MPADNGAYVKLAVSIGVCERIAAMFLDGIDLPPALREVGDQFVQAVMEAQNDD